MLLLNPLNFIREFCEVVTLVNELETAHERKGGRPIVKSIFGDAWNNLVTFINDPSFATGMAVYIDFSSYFLMPLEGGF